MLLIVDDDPVFLRNAEENLNEGRGILFARDAAHARTLLETVGGGIGVVLVDLDLPGQDGFSLIREVSREYPTMPVIAISGVVQLDVLESAKAMGARATLRKPVSPEWRKTIASVRGGAAS